MFKDVGLRVFLKMFIDSDDEVPYGFTLIANLKVCTNKFVNNESLKMKW